jgi:hypothetical protein
LIVSDHHPGLDPADIPAAPSGLPFPNPTRQCAECSGQQRDDRSDADVDDNTKNYQAKLPGLSSERKTKLTRAADDFATHVADQ